MLQLKLVYLGQGQDSLLYASLDEAGQLIPGTSVTLSLHESLVERIPQTLTVILLDDNAPAPCPALPQAPSSLMAHLLGRHELATA